MPQLGHIKIAIATNDLLQANGHFAHSKQIVFYDVSEDSYEFLDCTQFRGNGAGGAPVKGPGGGRGCAIGDPSEGVSTASVQDRIDAVRGCAMLFCKGLTDLHGVNVQNLEVYPVKLEFSREIPEVIAHVQGLIARPPLWLRRALGLVVPVAERLAA
jgi:nitrogen fixation protein NifX